MQIEERVKALVEEKIKDKPELFLVDVKMLPGNKLIIHIDGDEGVNVQDCADISRYVGFTLEEENAIENAYNLEVGSPGVGEPLKMHRQYVKNTGRTVKYTLTDGSVHEGVLQQVNDESLVIAETVKQKGKKAQTVETTVQVADIKEIKVIIKF